MQVQDPCQPIRNVCHHRLRSRPLRPHTALDRSLVCVYLGVGRWLISSIGVFFNRLNFSKLSPPTWVIIPFWSDGPGMVGTCRGGDAAKERCILAFPCIQNQMFDIYIYIYTCIHDMSGTIYSFSLVFWMLLH